MSVKPSTLSPKGREWLKRVEGLRLHPYDDQTGKSIQCWVPGATVGYGHLISQKEWPDLCKGLDVSTADSLFCRDLAPFEKAVAKIIHAELASNQFDALVILCYNIGAANFQASSLVRMINDPKARTSYPNLEMAWKAWARSQGKVMQGLVNRRCAEWKMFDQGSYEGW